MSQNRDWMYRDGYKNSQFVEDYFKGVIEFLDFAFSHPECVFDGMIRCPSRKCDFGRFKTRDDVHICLLKNGFVGNYKRWTRHGEHNTETKFTNVEDERNENKSSEMLREAADEPLLNGCEEEYASKLHEVNGLEPTAPVNAILSPECSAVSDPGCMKSERAVGVAKKRRRFGQPREKMSKCGGSSVDYEVYVDSLDVSEKMEKVKEDLEELKSSEMAQINKKLRYLQACISQQQAYLTSIASFLAQVAEKCGLPPPPPPPMLNDL